MSFTPPFCPHRHCPSNKSLEVLVENWFERRGFRHTKVVGQVPRFRCKLCGHGFSSRTFDIDYWTHRTVDYQLVQNLLVGGSGLRQASRTLGVSTRLLANRHIRLARQSLVLQSRATEDFSLREALVFDGFESFAFSQFYPNNIHLMVTSDSQFVLGFNAAVLRRKGRMTESQKLKRLAYEKEWRAPANAIYLSSKELLTLGCHISFGSRKLPIEFKTDEKREYRRALEQSLPYADWKQTGLLLHERTSSKAARTLQNPLFPVNYLDRQIRKDLAEHVRETVRFARRLEFSLERMAIHLTHHNYFKAFRNRCDDPELTHGEAAGLDRNALLAAKSQVFRDRGLGWRENLEKWQIDVWMRRTKVPVHRVTPLAKHLLTA